MSKLRRIIKNTFISLIGQAVTLIGAILLSYAYGHFLGTFAFGELYFATALVSLFGTPIASGFMSQVIRDVAQKPENAARIFSNVLLVKLIMWLVVYIALLLISWLLGFALEARMLIAICGLDLLFNAIVTTFASMCYAFENTIFPVLGGILEKGLTTLFGLVLLRSGAGVQIMAVVLVFGSLVSAILLATWYLRTFGVSFVIDPKLMREIVRTNIPFLISGFLLVGYTSIDTILLSVIRNATEVGLYGAVARIADTISSLPSIVMSIVMFPIISKLANTSDTDLKLVLEKSLNFMLFCGTPIAMLLIVAAPNIIGFLYGNRFIQAVPALQAFAPFVFFLFINNVLVTVVLSKRLDRVILINTASALVFNFVLNLVMIPIFHYIGAAIVTSLTEILLFCIAVFAIPRNLLSLASLKVAFKALIASLVMAIVIFPLHNLPLFVILPIAMFVYFGVSLFLSTIPREDYQAVINAIRRKKVQEGHVQSADDSSEIWGSIFDLPTMVIPAYRGVSLLDIEFAITGKLPMVRLPLAPQRTGLATNTLRRGETSSYALPVTPEPAYLAESTGGLADVEMMTTAILPAIPAQAELREPKAVRSNVTTTTAHVIMPVGMVRTFNPDRREHNENTGEENK